MKRSEVAVRDLSAAVSGSRLQSKEQLESSLDELASSIKQVVPLFSKIDAVMEGTVDYIIIVDELAIKTLQGVKGQNTLKPFVFHILWPFYSPSSAEERILDTFVKAATTLSQDVAHLIELSMGISQRLDVIETQFETINRIVHQDRQENKDQGETLFAELWTMIGGNRARLDMFISNSALLTELHLYHTTAANQVVNILMHLQRLSNQLGQLQTGLEKLLDRPPQVTWEKIRVPRSK
ncbi:hypothetical protein CPB86DRAFT_139231 [Serendipita vermifera]|nr:hypothetical protein CPB86DRAFT_139231 [Serendipita vermifera]